MKGVKKQFFKNEKSETFFFLVAEIRRRFRVIKKSALNLLTSDVNERNKLSDILIPKKHEKYFIFDITSRIFEGTFKYSFQNNILNNLNNQKIY